MPKGSYGVPLRADEWEEFSPGFGDNGHREATIYGSFEHEVSGRPRRVRVQLDPEHVDRATDAWRHGLEVVLRGDLEPHGTGLRMRAVTAFAVRQE